jgi:hypothetical protein
MLFGSWAEGKPRSGGQWVVALPEDKPAPLFTLLAIVHGKVDLVPPFIKGDKDDLGMMFDVLVAGDKYDLIKLLGSWAAGWLENVRCPGRNTIDAMIQRMHVAWQLGSQQRLSSILKELVFTFPQSQLNGLVEHSECCTTAGFPHVFCDLLKGRLPPHCAKKRIKSRLEADWLLN